MTRQSILGLFTLLMVVPSPACPAQVNTIPEAQSAAGEAALDAFLNQEYHRKGILAGLDSVLTNNRGDLARQGRRSDGAYWWVASLGDQLFAPHHRIADFCARSGAVLHRVLAAGGRPAFIQDRATVVLTGTTASLKTRDLWEWEGLSIPTTGFGATVNLAAVLHVSSPARAEQLEDNPAFGLFTCDATDVGTRWAAAIMPIHDAGANLEMLSIRPITASFVRDHNVSSVRAADLAVADEQRRRSKQTDEQRRMSEARIPEERRLEPFQQGLTLGSRTNCGMVVDVRGPLVEVQLPPSITAANGATRFWMRRNVLADYPAPQRCEAGR